MIMNIKLIIMNVFDKKINWFNTYFYSKHNPTVYRRRTVFKLKLFNEKKIILRPKPKLNFIAVLYHRFFQAFLPNFLFVVYFFIKPTTHVLQSWTTFNFFYFLPHYQQCLSLFVLYRKNLIFSFRKLLPLINKKNTALLKQPSSKTFFLSFLHRAVFIRYFNSSYYSNFLTWRPFYVWKNCLLYCNGPVWKIKNPNFYLFSFYSTKFFSSQVRFYSKNFSILGRVNLGSFKDVQINRSAYYFFIFLSQKMPTDYLYKSKLDLWFSRYWLYFLPHHNILPLGDVSAPPYIFKYASHKSISTPLRANE